MSHDSNMLLGFPTRETLETNRTLTATISAARRLAEAKGRAITIPNKDILIDTLALQEAKASSEIEQIITTQDELFKADLFPNSPNFRSAKEVMRCRNALKRGFLRLQERDFRISNDILIEMHGSLFDHMEGFRSGTYTAIVNAATGEVVHRPPQSKDKIITLMDELENYVNSCPADHPDPLIKMAVIHHRFENIHPFSDGNGRIGRILNVLYLTKVGLLGHPILCMSREINRTRSEYYRLLRIVETTGEWQDWIIYILGVVERSAAQTINFIEGIRALMEEFEQIIRANHPKIYSLDLLNSLFRHPYTKIDFIQRDLSISRPTASRYLGVLANSGLLNVHQFGARKYYVNERLVELFVGMEQ